MADKDDKIQKDKQKKEEDSRLWLAATHDVTPLPNRPKTIIAEPAKAAPSKAKMTPSVEIPRPIAKQQQKPEIDHRTAERLRKGQMPIEARLDLHGMNREKAYEALCSFIPRCHSRGMRCVLVITGKGARGPLEPETGILKQMTPEWLSSPPLEQFILKIQASKQKDGGAGAFYVLLRRKRD